jgi:hypothetical protein
MLNNKLDEINYNVDAAISYNYNALITIHENFVLYLKEVYNNVPHQYIGAKICYSDLGTRIILQVDADCQILTAQKIIFVFMYFLEEHFPPEIRFSNLWLEWT